MKKFLPLVVTATLLLVACAEGEVKDSAAQTEESQAIASEKGLTLANPGIDQTKYEETMAGFPQEVASSIAVTSVPIAEMLYLLEIEPVGVPTSTNPLPQGFDVIEQIGSPMTPDLERITNLAPELLLGASSLKSSLEKSLEGLELQTAYLPTDSYDDLKLSFKALGTYLGKEQSMNKHLQTILDKENDLLQKAKGQKLPNVLLMIGTSDSFMVMSEKSYVGSLINRLGAENVATTQLKVAETYSAVNLEEVVAIDPDLIFVLASGDHGASQKMFQDEVAKNAAWTQLAAYQSDNIHILDYSVFGVTSIINAPEALTQIADYFIQ